VLGRADQFVIKKDGRPVNNRSALMIVEVVGEDAGLKIEHDHQLVWLEPLEALRRIRHGSHAWAITCWLRTEP
jgi:8-oxo-dGTP diphosphatase